MIGMVAGKDYVDWLNTMDTVHNFIINHTTLKETISSPPRKKNYDIS
jgi:hypothetical protein